MKTTLSFLTLLLGLTARMFGDGLIVIHEPTHVPAGHYAFAPLEVTWHHVNVKIVGPIATTAIDQEFYNPNNQRLEGTYLFPVPKGAHLDKFTMEIGGQQVEAELLPADKARGIYEDIVRKMRDPALLEYADRDTFKVRVFPIEPHSRKRITLAYSEVLKADGGLVSYLYPLNTEKFSARPLKDVSIKVELESPRPIKSIYSPTHNVELHRHGATRATVGYEGHDVKPDTDFQLFFAPEEADIGVSLMTFKNGGEDGYFLLLASPGADLKTGPAVFKDVAFVLDTSGSMAGKKLEQAKKALQFCVENLNDGDRFEVIRFSTETEPLFEKLVEANREHRDRALAFIKDLRPIGGTAIEEALRKALAMRPAKGDRPYVIIFLTDGQPTVGTTDENQIVATAEKESAGRTRIFCFGIGTDVNTHLLDKITEATRAFSQYVMPEEDIEVKVSSFYTKIKEPVLSEVKLRFSGDVRVSKLYPSPMPDLFRGDQLVVVGRYAGHGGSAAIIEGTVNGVPKKFAYDVQFPASSADHEFIPRLWATRRVGYLLDESRLHGENKELRDEITELARQYGIVTPYTAYLIVEDESRRNVPATARSLQSFEHDRAARDEAGEAWKTYNMVMTGESAMAGARASGALKQTTAPAGPSSVASTELLRAMTAAAPEKAKVIERIDQYTQQTRFVRGRTFFQNGSQWIDSNVQKLSNARRIPIQFNSKEYFDLIAKYPQARPWLSVGRNLQVALDETIYEITE